MFVQKVPHIKDQFLTQERASMELESGQIAVGWYTNEQDSQSVVHSHPYYELVLPLVGSNVRYSVDGNIYDINLGEMIIFPARCYHAGMFNITDKISERLIAQISTQHMVQRCELVELLLLMDQIVDERRTAPPSATSALVAKAVAFLQANYTDPNLTVGSLAKYTYTSREHLSRAFKTYTMESVHGYLTNLRMQHCRRAIAAGASVLDACNASGFTNYTSFLKTFRSLYGITPSEYRNQLRRTPERVHSTP